MTALLKRLPPDRAWRSIDRQEWDAAHARHLLRRIGFSATPAEVEQTVVDGMLKTLDQRFGSIRELPEPEPNKELRVDEETHYTRYREAETDEKRREISAAHRRKQQAAYSSMGVEWLRFARDPHNSAQEKWVDFLQNIFVVSYGKVRGTRLFDHQVILRKHSLGSYPDLCKAVSRSWAMIRFLDLDRNTKGRPNENFARELYELFILGEGNYSEQDIKETARAFTGYRANRKGFAHNKQLFDDGEKSIFGETGNWNGDDAIDIAFRQPSASTFFPREMLRHYLSETPLPEPYIQELGKLWRAHDFSLQYLLRTVFSSRLFYHPSFRGSLIKSPNHYYIGLCQDLQLDVRPFNSILNNLRTMGQPFFAPPNVRGWVGGRHWINAATLIARRQLVEQFFTPINEERLNADDAAALTKAKESGFHHFHVEADRVRQLAAGDPEEITNQLIRTFLPVRPEAGFRRVIEKYLAQNLEDKKRTESLKASTISILQSPYYQLC